MIKKQILMLVASILIGVSAFSQKSELKAADKAVKKGDYATALAAVNQAESLVANADSKTQAKFYYLKGMALYADGNNSENIDAVAEAFNQLLTIEQKSGSSTYSEAAGEILEKLITEVAETAQKDFESARAMNDSEGYNKAARGYERVYLLSPKDTSFLYNSALVSSIGKDYEKSNEQYQRLVDMGYTGVYTVYKATSKVDGEDMIFASEKDMDLKVKIGVADNPKIETSESKVNDMIIAIAKNHVAMGQDDKALEVFAVARENNPNDATLITEEAYAYYRLGNNEMFKQKLEEAIKFNPTDPNLYYNIGVTSMNIGDAESAKKSFEKVVELDPEYSQAYLNLGALVLDAEQEVLDELNANASNFAKYDRIKAEKLLPIYKEAIPYYEKAYEFDQDEPTKNLLNTLYENLGMEKRID